MGALKGHPPYNVNGEGGRPPKYDISQEAKDLLEWSLKEDSDSLYAFCRNKPYRTWQLWDFSQRSDEFDEVLKKVKENIAFNRERLCNKGLMNYGVWARSAGIYDHLSKSYEDGLKDDDLKRKVKLLEHELKLKNEIMENLPEDLKSNFESLMEQLTKRQSFSKSSEADKILKNAEKSNNAERKS